MIISNKILSSKLFERGSFGNSIKLWNSIEELKADKNITDLVCIRYKGSYGGAFCYYNIPKEKVEEKYKEILSQGYQKELIYFNDSSNREVDLVLQGEIMETPCGWYLLYSTVKEKMRVALKQESKHLQGLAVKQLLKSVMFETSYEDLLALFELYPDHVIEFQVTSTAVGDNPNRNTIFWEVRQY